MSRPPFPETPFYCEENAWQALRHAAACGEPGPHEAIVITNSRRTCALWSQRAAPPGEPVVWDYHVVARVGAHLWDPDCTAGWCLTTADWLDATFPPLVRLPADLRPRFRVVPGADYVRDLHSTRAHMRRRDGTYRRPPPPWPAPTAGTGALPLARLLDLSDPSDAVLPPALTLDEVRRHLARDPAPGATPCIASRP